MAWERALELIKQIARKLRRDQTESEAVFWKAVRSRGFSGKKFLRQHPLKFKQNGKKRFFIADFYCREANLVIEIDGGIHKHKDQKAYDKAREDIIECLGLKVLRFSNDRIEKDLDGVLEELKVELTPLNGN